MHPNDDVRSLNKPQGSKLTITFKWKSYILQSWALIQVLDNYVRQTAISQGICNLTQAL